MFCLLLAPSVWGQGNNDVKLANHYYQKGEFDKAEVYYKKLVNKSNSQTFFDRYFLCLFYQEKFTDAEKVVAKRIKKEPYYLEHKFKLGSVYEVTERQEKADELYAKLIDDLVPMQSEIEALGKKFKLLGKYDDALKTYLKGKKILKRDGYGFQMELAELYSLKNQPDKMIQEYLNLLEYSPVYLKSVQTYLSRAVDFEEDKDRVEMLKNEILLRVQKYPNKDYYTEMFIWFYLHKKEFTGAVIQAKALDKRKKEKGKRVYEVGMVCMTNESYSAAKSAFQYIIDMGETSQYYHASVESKLWIQFTEVTEKRAYSKEQLNEVALDFERTLSDLGKNRYTLGIMVQLAKMYAFYMEAPEKAEALISEAMELPIHNRDKAELKVLLGDVYIVSNKIWEASLLYMQVEKQFSEDVLGHEAKFKNAKVFYYDGEFEYAKAQLDVLKASTSKLIANDAMQLSLLLQDNLTMDTTLAPVQLFANADLLLQQNRYQEALTLLDSLNGRFPFHSITDEVLFKRGEIYEERQEWEQAIGSYTTVLESYAHDILADDAAFRMAKIYQDRLGDKEKAAEYYKKILYEFPSSLFVAESRKKYREIKATFL